MLRIEHIWAAGAGSWFNNLFRAESAAEFAICLTLTVFMVYMTRIESKAK